MPLRALLIAHLPPHGNGYFSLEKAAQVAGGYTYGNHGVRDDGRRDGVEVEGHGKCGG